METLILNNRNVEIFTNNDSYFIDITIKVSPFEENLLAFQLTERFERRYFVFDEALSKMASSLHKFKPKEKLNR